MTMPEIGDVWEHTVSGRRYEVVSIELGRQYPCKGRLLGHGNLEYVCSITLGNVHRHKDWQRVDDFLEWAMKVRKAAGVELEVGP